MDTNTKSIGELALEIPHAIGTTPAVDEARDWSSESLETLQQYIIDTHHVFTRQAMETIGVLSERVANRHGAGHPEVLRVRELVVALCNDLEPHMMKEEVVLFPYVAALERGEEAPNCFGTVRNPVRMMMLEHDAVGGLLHDLRDATGGYALPDDACLSFHALYERLVELEQDLHKHIHLENNVHFPRAIEMEDGQ